MPALGKSGTEDRVITGSHMAERCHLFVIIALGESIVVTGSTFAAHSPSATALLALVTAFLGSVALWWIYCDRSAHFGAQAIAASDNPAGSLAAASPVPRPLAPPPDRRNLVPGHKTVFVHTGGLPGLFGHPAAIEQAERGLTQFTIDARPS